MDQERRAPGAAFFAACRSPHASTYACYDGFLGPSVPASVTRKTHKFMFPNELGENCELPECNCPLAVLCPRAFTICRTCLVNRLDHVSLCSACASCCVCVCVTDASTARVHQLHFAHFCSHEARRIKARTRRSCQTCSRRFSFVERVRTRTHIRDKHVHTNTHTHKLTHSCSLTCLSSRLSCACTDDAGTGRAQQQ